MGSLQPRQRCCQPHGDPLSTAAVATHHRRSGLVAYELIVPREQLGTLMVTSNIIWAVFGIELVAKLVVSHHPARFLRRHRPSVLFPTPAAGPRAPPRTGAARRAGGRLHLAISASMVYELVTLAGRLLAIVLSAYTTVVFASLAATIGAFFVEACQERSAHEDGGP